MNRQILTFLWIVVASYSGMGQNSDYFNYIEKYKKISIKEMERTGIPASIKLAQGLLESNAGKSELARRANNHFGIKCHDEWTGKKYYKKDDDYDEFGNLKKSCFRRYKNATDSYIAHSEFLRDPNKANRYGFLFRLDSDDYKRWARGLKRAGYATSANYDNKLIQLIELYELNRFDKMALDRFEDEIKPDDMIAGLDVHLVNDAKVVFAKNDITLQQISLASDIGMKRLAKYNEQLPAETDTLATGYRVFLQPKRCNYRGHQKWHYVQADQSMFDISQMYGIKLSRLYGRNRMPVGTEPRPGERIKLSGWRIKRGTRPRLQSEPGPSSTVPNLDEEYLEEVEAPQNNDNTNPGSMNPTQPNNPTGGNSVQEPANQEVYYTVVKGDTLYSISKRYGTTVEAIQKLNNLTGTNIQIGQLLRIQ